MQEKYIYYNSCFDKELLRKQTIILNDNDVDYKIINKRIKSHFRAPMGGYFEVEVHILENDFDRAERLLNSISE